MKQIAQEVARGAQHTLGMGIFTDLLNTLRPAPPVEGVPTPEPVTFDDLAAMLARVQTERGEAEALIGGAAHRRDELLLQPGTDAAIRKLERDVDAAHLLLERLNLIEPELRGRLHAAKKDDKAAAWVDQRTRLIDQLRLCQVTMEAYFGAFNTLLQLRGELDRAGFGREVDLLPWRTWDVSGPGIYAGLAQTYANRGTFMVADPQDALVNVRFVSFTVAFEGTPSMTAYQAEQEAGFHPDYARLLVDKGFAVLADTKPLPAAPKRKPRRGHTREEAIRLAEVQTGGRRPVPQRDAPEPLPLEHPTRTWTRLDPTGGL